MHKRESSRQSNDTIAPPMCGDRRAAGAGKRAMGVGNTTFAWTTGAVRFALDTDAIQWWGGGTVKLELRGEWKKPLRGGRPPQTPAKLIESIVLVLHFLQRKGHGGRSPGDNLGEPFPDNRIGGKGTKNRSLA